MRVGIYSDYIGLTTAYGQDTYHMLKGLSEKGFEAINYAKQYTGFPINVHGISIYPATTDDELKRSIRQSNPDVVISFGDLWQYTSFVYSPHHIIDMVHDAGAVLINYSPVQQLPMPPEIDDAIENDADLTLFTTRWAMEHFWKKHNNVGFLPHGVSDGIRSIDIDRNNRPLGLPQGTMLMNVGYSLDPRKQTPLVLKLLADYRQYDETAFAYMHTQIHSYYANDVFVRNLGLPKDKVIFKPYTDSANNLHDSSLERLNMLYNSADVYINLSSSEGFGQTELEAASLGIPTLVTDTPVHREVLGGYRSVRFIKSYEWIPTVWWFEHMPDMNAALEEMLSLKDKGFKKESPHVKEDHRWSNIIDRLIRIINHL